MKRPTIRGAAAALFAAALLLGGCSSAPPPRFAPESVLLPAERTTLAMRIVQNLPMVPVSVQGGEPRWFIIDTGAEACVVSRTLAGELGLASDGAGLDVIGTDVDASRRATVCRVERLMIGGVAVGPLHVCVLDLEQLGEAIGTSFDGILGWNTFRGCTVTLDYPDETLIIERGAVLREGDPEVLSFMENDGLPEILATIDGRAVALLVDTGSNETLAFPRSIAGSLRFKSAPVAMHPSTTITGRDTRDLVARLDADVHLGPHLIAEPVVMLASGPGRVGGGVLSHYALTFDRASSLMRMSRGSREPLRTGAVRSAGLSILRGPEGWYVGDVLPGSPSDRQGVRRDDLILAVDGIDTASLTPDLWQALVRQSPTLDLILQRAGRTFRVQLEIVDLVE